MKLRVVGDGNDWRVENAETGDVLEGVEWVRLEVGWLHRGIRAELKLKGAAIDIAIDANRVEALTTEGDKFAISKLLDVARLPWKSKV